MTGAVVWDATSASAAAADLCIFGPLVTFPAPPPPATAHGAVPCLLSTLILAPSGMTAGLITRRFKFLGAATSREDMNQLKTHAMAKRARTMPMMTTSETYRKSVEMKHPVEILSMFPA